MRSQPIPHFRTHSPSVQGSNPCGPTNCLILQRHISSPTPISEQLGSDFVERRAKIFMIRMAVNRLRCVHA